MLTLSPRLAVHLAIATPAIPAPPEQTVTPAAVPPANVRSGALTDPEAKKCLRPSWERHPSEASETPSEGRAASKDGLRPSGCHEMSQDEGGGGVAGNVKSGVRPFASPPAAGETPRCPGCRQPAVPGRYTESVACGFCEARLLQDLAREDGEEPEAPTTWPPEDEPDLPPEKEPQEEEPEPEPDDADSYAAPEGAWRDLWAWLDEVGGGL